MNCIKEMPCTLKFAYVLIAILFVVNIACWMGCMGKGGSSNDVAAWVNDNPQAILESVNKFVMKQQEEAQKQQQEQASVNIGKFEKDLKDTKYSGVINAKGTVEMVEFYDYNCHYCKIAAKNVEELLKTRSDVKVILRAIPILGEPSNYATQVGMAIIMSEPTKYPTFHKAIMEGSARTKEDVAKAVKSAGLDMSAIEKVMSKNKAEIEAAINKNLDLAKNIGINGTPAFVINGELIPGAVDAQTLNQKLSK